MDYDVNRPSTKVQVFKKQMIWVILAPNDETVNFGLSPLNQKYITVNWATAGQNKAIWRQNIDQRFWYVEGISQANIFCFQFLSCEH